MPPPLTWACATLCTSHSLYTAFLWFYLAFKALYIKNQILNHRFSMEFLQYCSVEGTHGTLSSPYVSLHGVSPFSNAGPTWRRVSRGGHLTHQLPETTASVGLHALYTSPSVPRINPTIFWIINCLNWLNLETSAELTGPPLGPCHKHAIKHILESSSGQPTGPLQHMVDAQITRCKEVNGNMGSYILGWGADRV